MDKNKALIVYVGRENEFLSKIKGFKASLDTLCKAYFKARYKYLICFITEFFLFYYFGIIFSKLNPELCFDFTKSSVNPIALFLFLLVALSMNKISARFFSGFNTAAFALYIGAIQSSQILLNPISDSIYLIFIYAVYTLFTFTFTLYLTENCFFQDKIERYSESKEKIKRYVFRIVMNIIMVFLMLLLFNLF